MKKYFLIVAVIMSAVISSFEHDEITAEIITATIKKYFFMFNSV